MSQARAVHVARASYFNGPQAYSYNCNTGSEGLVLKAPRWDRRTYGQYRNKRKQTRKHCISRYILFDTQFHMAHCRKQEALTAVEGCGTMNAGGSSKRPTPHRNRILQALKDWFAKNEESPTLAELCVLLGMDPKTRRATVQRWLQTMTEDIEYEPRQRRSIRLKPGVMVVPTFEVDLHAGLRYMATGLVRHAAVPVEDRAIPNDALRIGMAYVWVASAMEVVARPQGLPDILNWTETPLGEWAPARKLPWLSDQAQLIEDGVPSDFARYLAVDGEDLVGQVDESVFHELLVFCRTRGLEEAYRTLRSMVISQPVISYREYRQVLESKALAPVRAFVSRIYRDLEELGVQAEYPICPRCHYPSRVRPDGTHACRNGFCDRLSRRTQLPTVPPIPVKAAPEWKVVAPGIHRWVTLPGLWELRLAQELTALGLTVVLYPHVDLYDLLVTFPSGPQWAIDVKDWPDVSPQRIESVSRQFNCDKTFLVLPDEREHRMDALRASYRQELNGVDLRTIGELLAEAVRLLGGGRRP